MQIDQLNKTLNLWVRVKIINLYNFLSDILHSQVCIILLESSNFKGLY